MVRSKFKFIFSLGVILLVEFVERRLERAEHVLMEIQGNPSPTIIIPLRVFCSRKGYLRLYAVSWVLLGGDLSISTCMLWAECYLVETCCTPPACCELSVTWWRLVDLHLHAVSWVLRGGDLLYSTCMLWAECYEVETCCSPQGNSFVKNKTINRLSSTYLIISIDNSTSVMSYSKQLMWSEG